MSKNDSESLVDFEKGKKLCLGFINDGSKILDIGCGDARFFDIVKKSVKNCEFYGNDIEKESEKIIKKKGYNFLKNLDVNKKFDVISMFELIEHLDYDNLLKMTGRINHLLKKKGLLIISTPNFPNLEELNHFWDNAQHKRPYNKAALQRLFAGYTLLKHTYFCPQLNPVKVLMNIILGFKPFMNQLFIFQKN